MDTRTLQRQCVQNVCYCDWRLTIYNCAYERVLWWTLLLHIVFSAAMAIFAFSIFLYRYRVQGHRLFELGAKSWFKTMPVDCFFFFLAIHNFLRMFTSVILVTDWIPDNMVARSFMFEFPWQWGYCACAFYLLGVVQTLINSNGKTATVMGSTRHDAHVLGMVLVVSPFIVNNGCALSAGFLATTNVFTAEVITRLLYASWVVHCGVLGFFVLLMGFRLLKVVTQHINRVKSKSYDPVHKAKLLASSGKIRAIIYVIFTALASFVLLLCFYSLFRDWVIQTVSVSLFGCILWNYLSTTLTLLASVLFLRSPRRHLNNAHLAHPSSGHDVPQVETTFGEIVTDELMMNESCPSEISSVAMETLQKLRSMAPPLPPPPPLHDPSSSSSFKPSSSSAISSSGKSFSTSQHDFYDSSSSTLVAQ